MAGTQHSDRDSALRDLEAKVQACTREARFDILDKHLPISHQQLRTKLTAAGIQDADQVAETFDKEQWAFCPAKFELHSGQTYTEHKILPIYRKEEINTKGGTAKVYQIDVKEEFVGDSLRQAVAFSRHNCSPPGTEPDWCYQFALKSFGDGNMVLFQNESEAFDALRNHNGMVRYLADYTHAEKTDVDLQTQSTPSGSRERCVIRNTFNLLLEFGEFDLDEFFAERLPPVLQGETEDFWRALFDVASALDGIHNLKLDRHGVVREFDGWHADVKPDNILSVQGRFKLSDPGFAKFVRKTDRDPKEFLLGGTETYGAPERHPTRGTMSAVSQAIDIWSLGCVFSIAATWVVFGYQGIQQFRKVRQNAIEKFRTKPIRQQNLASVSTISAGDYFHDGHDVLEAVTAWHTVLRGALRKTDMVTSELLDLVDQKMLLGSASSRIKARDLYSDLKRIMDRSETGPRVEMPGSIMETLLEADKDAASSVPSTAGSNLAQLQDARDDRKARKSRLLQQSLMKTAHRSEGLRSVLASYHAQPADIGVNHSHPTAGIVNPNLPDPRIDIPFKSSTRRGRPPSTPIPKIPIDIANSHSESGQSLTLNQQKMKATRTPKLHKPQDLFEALEEIERRDKYNYFRKDRKDELLSRHWVNRDLRFLVDNGESMIPHWAWAKFLLKVLVRKAAGQDENGLDLSFTLGRENLENQKSNSKQWEKVMDKARPMLGTRTDMKAPMGEILDGFFKQVQHQMRYQPTKPIRKLTLIILTDGIWAGMGNNQTSVNEIIIKFVQELAFTVGNLLDRPVSIEFIQFGNNQEATYRLRQLDTGMKWQGIPDIIDTEHASGDVNKMLLGSFVQEYDDEDEDNPMQDPETPSRGESRPPGKLPSINSQSRSLTRGSTNRSISPSQPSVFISRPTS
ncbi:MAG: hypothetical protein Q9216_001978 [Gyalolechia sp. 2 TL-2023]